jgi:hypothetical protein
MASAFRAEKDLGRKALAWRDFFPPGKKFPRSLAANKVFLLLSTRERSLTPDNCSLVAVI